MKMKNNLEAFKELIRTSERIAVVSHMNPDGDNLGSLLAAGLSLEKMGKGVLFVKADIIPEDYRFLPGVERLSPVDETIDMLDLLLVLDSSDPDRLGENRFLIDKSQKVVNIDHHVSNSEFGDINIVKPEMSSTGEILFELLLQMDMPIDSEIASLIYVAMSTDTGRFTYQGVTGKTHETVARLYGYGIDAYAINNSLYQRRSLERTKLFIRAVSNIRLYKDNRIGIVRVTKSMLDETGSSMEDTEGIVEFIRDTDSVEAACILKEIDDGVVKISLRTKNIVDANKVCSVFHGGGHSRASGATVEDTIDNVESRLLDEINKYL
ncbi:MAG TPA: bifunctional oligoribonuclease/PAP phosphatase NrnA [Tissierellaceae bacterium]|jgi:phosphoesterase RecJ-like protein|nr:bifunctional oligoribonuclease/PAP phosphatase NrnA [Tissierellaceae bacterium]